MKRERYDSRVVGGEERSSDFNMSLEKAVMSILRKERDCLVIVEGLDLVGIDRVE